MQARPVFPLLMLVFLLLASCSQPNVPPPTITPQPAIALTAASTASPVPSSTPTATEAPTSQPASSATPTSTSIPTPELLTCQEPSLQTEAIQPVKLLYVNGNGVWLWDEASREKTRAPLPEDATAPQISPDGQLIAFLKQGQAFDTPDQPVETIPLWLIDRKSGQSRQISSFNTTETRHLFPEAPQILLQIEWLPGGHWLLVQVYPVPWGEGILQPTGDLFLVNADTGLRQRILKGNDYVRYSISPNGKQVAALGTGFLSPNGTWNEAAIQEGTLHLIELPPDHGIRRLQLRLPSNPWMIRAPVYSPDDAHMALQVEAGMAVIDAQNGQVLQVPIKNPCATAGCFWGSLFNVTWLPDNKSFFTLTSKNDHFDDSAETSLYLIRLEPSISIDLVQVIHADPYTFSFTEDRKIVSYWNQPDPDAPEETMNWVTLHLMDLQKGQPRRYTAEFSLRPISWSPDNRRFLYIYSPFGGPNQVADRLALGDICQPPSYLPVPEGRLIQEARWLDPIRFLAWTLPPDGIPDRYTTGLYLYSLFGYSQPIHIDDQLKDQIAPYGMQSQVVVLDP